MNRDDDLRDELRAHLDMATADRVARGQRPDEAAAHARRQLGNVAQIAEAARDVWGRRWLTHAAQDLRYGLRAFRRHPGFACVAVLSLTLGIGANTALFEVVNAVRLKTLPVADPSSLAEIRLAEMDVRGQRETWHTAVTYPIWRALPARQQAFSPLFAWSRDAFNLSAGGEIRLAQGLWVSGSLFPALGLRPAAGRLIAEADDVPGCPARAVISEAFWRRAYGASPAVVGQTLALAAHSVEIVGVAPASFHGMEVGKSFDVALPLCADPLFSEDGRGRLELGADWWLSVFGRLKPGWTLERASAHVAALSPELFRATLPAAYPVSNVKNYLALKLIAVPGGAGLSQLREDYTASLWLLLAVAALVLAIACANLANLLLARATARQREFAVRLSLGASRGRIVRQLLTEGLLLAACGTAGALAVAGTLSRALVAFLDSGADPLTLSLGVDWRVAGFAAAIALATTLLFSLAPALQSTGIGAASVIRATARGTTAGRDAAVLRRTLVVAQVALSIVLLFGALLFARSLRAVTSIDPGFRPDGLVVAGVSFRRAGVLSDRRSEFRDALVSRIRGIPGVEGAATVSIVPLSGDAWGNTVWIDGERARPFQARLNSVGTGYFTTVGTPLVSGREFDAHDMRQSMPVALVNEAFAARQAQGRPVVGAHVTRESTMTTPEQTFEIIGIASNAAYADLREEQMPVVYFADAQSTAPAFARILVRSTLPPAAVTGAITGVLTQLDPRVTVAYSVVASDIRDSLTRERMLAVVSGGFGVLAGALTIVGLYGLVAYTVARRTTEIGVRLALGATARDVARLLLKETGLLLAMGMAAGIVLALAAGPAAASLLFQIKPYDPIALGGAAAALAVVALAACVGPTRRATRIEPIVALRTE